MKECDNIDKLQIYGGLREYITERRLLLFHDSHSGQPNPMDPPPPPPFEKNKNNKPLLASILYTRHAEIYSREVKAFRAVLKKIVNNVFFT